MTIFGNEIVGLDWLIVVDFSLLALILIVVFSINIISIFEVIVDDYKIKRNKKIEKKLKVIKDDASKYNL